MTNLIDNLSGTSSAEFPVMIQVINDLKTMNETYKNHLRNKEEQLLSLTSNVDAISETVDSYQQINLELRTRIEQFQAEIADLQQTLDGEQVKFSCLKGHWAHFPSTPITRIQWDVTTTD